MLLIGILLVQLSSGEEKTLTNRPGNRLLGIAASFAAALCSGFGSVYFEKILKDSVLSYWLRNVQLALSSILIGTINCWFIEADTMRDKGYFFG